MKFRGIKRMKCREIGKLLLLVALFYFATFVSGIMFPNNIFILTIVAITLIISYLFILYLCLMCFINIVKYNMLILINFVMNIKKIKNR